MKRTCGSVRSSSSAPAWLATAGSEAAETIYRRPSGAEGQPRGSLSDCERQCGPGLSWMTCPTQVNCVSTVRVKEPKALLGSGQKALPFGCPISDWDTRTNPNGRCSAGTKSSVLRERNRLTPTPRPSGQVWPRGRTHGVAGRGYWRKRMPSCNGADRGCNITPPRKRADFQWVVRYETAGRTAIGGDRK